MATVTYKGPAGRRRFSVGQRGVPTLTLTKDEPTEVPEGVAEALKANPYIEVSMTGAKKPTKKKAEEVTTDGD